MLLLTFTQVIHVGSYVVLVSLIALLLAVGLAIEIPLAVAIVAFALAAVAASAPLLALLAFMWFVSLVMERIFPDDHKTSSNESVSEGVPAEPRDVDAHATGEVHGAKL